MVKRKIGEDGEFIALEPESRARRWFWIGVFTPIVVAVIGAIALVVSGNERVVVRVVYAFSDIGYQGLIDQSVQSTLTALPSQVPMIETSAPQIIEVPVTAIVERVITATSIPQTATNIPPTATRAYYEESQLADIEPAVNIYIWDRLPNQNFIMCFVAAWDYSAFSLGLTVTNTSSQQFLLRFDPQAFSLVDNAGREYRVRGAGIGDCDREPGLRSQILNPGDDADIFLGFEGEIGMDVEYFLLTAENISGSGPFVFRKEI